MSKLSQEERDKLPEEDFGDPKGRRFPIVDSDDVSSAAHLIGKAGGPEEQEKVKKRIIAIAKRKKLPLPDAWKDSDGDDDADMSNIIDFTKIGDNMEQLQALFNTSDTHTVALGDYVIRDAPLIFKADNYPDKDFSMSPEEAKAAVADFNNRKEPVHLRASHTPNPLDGKIGRIAALFTDNDGKISGKVAIPRWLHEEFKGQPIPLSAGWSKKTKKLTHVALVNSPRVDGAKIEAAFQAFAKTKREREAEIFKALAEVNFDAADGDGRTATPHGQSRMQYIHDISASWGALCRTDKEKDDDADDGNPAFAADRKILEAIFTSEAEHGALQAIHDMTTKTGATCTTSTIGGVLGGKGGPPAQYYPATSTNYYGEKGYTFDMPNSNDPAVQALQKQFADFAASTKAEIDTLKGVNKTLTAKNEELRQDKLKEECTNFAKEMVRDRRILPAEEQNVYFDLLRAGEDDHKSPAEVTFDIGGGQQKTGTRLEAKKAMYKQRPQHFLNQELLSGNGTPVTVLFDNANGGAAGDDASKRHGNLFKPGEYERLMRMTPLGNAVADGKQNKS